jgi:hypothetical protein
LLNCSFGYAANLRSLWFFFFWGFAGILDDLEASKTILCTVLLSLIKSFTLKYTSLNFLGLALGHDE